MRVAEIRLKNFRLLTDVELVLEPRTTVVVGRNNSGKTSLSEVLRRLLGETSAVFQLEDFSTASYDRFCAALKAFNGGEGEDAVRALIPAIELRIFVQYDSSDPELGPLGPFVIDLDENCDRALVVVQYQLRDGAVSAFFEDMPADELTEETRLEFFKTLRDRIPGTFVLSVHAEDPNDPTNCRPLTQTALRALLKPGFINAQRGLDDVTSRESDILAKVLETMFTTAASATADEEDRKVVEALEEAVGEIQKQIDTNFANQLKSLLPTLQTFGYPGLGGQELQTETTLDVRRLLSNFTRIRYSGYGGITLPEAYNGLGVRNLIFILLQIVGFYKAYRAEQVAPSVHLIFIEEPEAHLHPQMQEVFIRQLAKIADQLVEATGDSATWPVQFVVSTHSSHVANEAGFERIRYFLATELGEPPGVRTTKIKDLRTGMAGTPSEVRNFLHQYLTLTRCDLFFADKAILVEGLSERLMLPVIVGKIESADTTAARLSAQYTTVIEVGGAYAHRFSELLDFLELRSLVITDLDSVDGPGGARCAVHSATSTSNACLKAWFSTEELGPAALLTKADGDKCHGRQRIAYQVPEVDSGPCGRTFEDAFLLANREKFELSGTSPAELEDAAFATATSLKKSEFALKYAIEDTDWTAPRYLVDGLKWLAADAPILTDPLLAVAQAAAAETTETSAESENG